MTPATMPGRMLAGSHDPHLQGACHQVMTLGQYIQGNLLVWPELIELASAERARLCAG